MLPKNLLVFTLSFSFPVTHFHLIVFSKGSVAFANNNPISWSLHFSNTSYVGTSSAGIGTLWLAGQSRGCLFL